MHMTARKARAAILALALGSAAPAAAAPLSIASTGHATVAVTGSFGTKDFVFDTGAEGSAVYAAFADATGLEAKGTELLQGQTGQSDITTVNLGAIEVDGQRFGPIVAARLDDRADGVPLAGILGLDAFGGALVDFDLPAMRVDLHPSGTALGLAARPLRATPTTGALLTIPVTIDGVAAVAVIDTGARKTRINWALGRKLGLCPDTLAAGDAVQGATNTAVETRVATVRQVRLGARLLKTAPVLVADLPVFAAFGVDDRPAIILGLDWLTATRMVVDFPARLVWFEAAAPR